MASEAPVAVVGAGTIGAGWAVLFARAGHTVRLPDVEAARLEAGLDDVLRRLRLLARTGLLDEPPESIHARVSPCPELGAAVVGVVHVQECAPEEAELKRALFGELDR